MSAPVNVRLPEQMVEFLDDLVRRGLVPNRTAAISTAIEREIRARQAMNDVEALQQQGTQDDLDDLVAWSADRAVIQD
ncbi:ribbon-helix-helix domain-containing protein [uncultured Agrococcus sp.]|uniref:ribbon-helix-helix domain-containing protein n=1 Tax=uncultured Agrococcus sp. TaxID=382258 RepID=UPI0025F7693B|nr:ribbon-helix-helix domain-containing protein [uncultured Agrococcus sp.]